MNHTKRWQTWLLSSWLCRSLLGHCWWYRLARWSLYKASGASILSISFSRYFTLRLVHLLILLASLHIESAWESPWAKSGFSFKLLFTDLSWCEHLLCGCWSLHHLRVLNWFKALDYSHITRFNLLLLNMHHVREYRWSLWLLSLPKGRLSLRLGQSLLLYLTLLRRIFLFGRPIVYNLWTYSHWSFILLSNLDLLRSLLMSLHNLEIGQWLASRWRPKHAWIKLVSAHADKLLACFPSTATGWVSIVFKLLMVYLKVLAVDLICLSQSLQVLEVLHRHCRCYFAFIWYTTIIIQRTLDWYLWIRLFLFPLHWVWTLYLDHIDLTLVSAFHNNSGLGWSQICLWSHYKVREWTCLLHILGIFRGTLLPLGCARTCDLLLRCLKLRITSSNCCWRRLLHPHLSIIELRWQPSTWRLTWDIILSVYEKVLSLIILS